MSDEDELVWPETTRQLAALYQITGAIEHFHKHEWECAITLAGAAEGVLPDAQDGFLLHQLKQSLARRGGDPVDFNFVQNWLKHGKYKGTEIESMRINEFLAVVSLQRAITKFVAVHHAETPEMAKFMIWCQEEDYPAARKVKRKPPASLNVVR